MSKKIKKEPEIKPKIVHTFYSNGIGGGYSSDDFFINFIQYPEDDEDHVITTRIFLTPISFKESLIFLKERLEKYEKDYGEIKLKEEKSE